MTNTCAFVTKTVWLHNEQQVQECDLASVTGQAATKAK
jgi:hypothetical protein